MKRYISAVALSLLLFANSCQKCFDCKQYCGYCIANNNNGVVLKICADKDVARTKVDSLYFAFKSAGYECNLLNNEKKVCDQNNKINDALDYYKLQNYYCTPWAE